MITPKEMMGFEKITSLHEILVGDKIKLYPNGQTNCVNWSHEKQQYCIVLKTDNDATIDPYFALKHELFHCLFNTPLKTIKSVMDKITENIPKDLEHIGWEMAHAVSNILEDERIESLGGELYIGDRIGLNKIKSELGNEMTQVDNPIDALLAMRFKNPAIVPEEFAIASQYIKDVAFTSPDATIILTKKYIDEVVIPWIIKNNLTEKKPEPQGTPSGNPKPEGQTGENSPVANEDPNEKSSEENTKQQGKKQWWEKEIKTDPILPKSRPNKTIQSLKKQCEGINKDSPLPPIENTDTDDYDFDWNQTIEDMRKEGNRKLDELKNILEKLTSSKKIIETNYTAIERKEPNSQTIKSIPNISQNIKTVIKKIMGSKTIKNDEIGDDLDIDAVIDYKLNKNTTEIFYDDTKSQGVSIVISIDLSGSMSGVFQKMLSICASIMEPLEKVQNVEIISQGWNDCVQPIQISTIRHASELNMMAYPGGTTPTGFGIAEARKLLKHSKYKEKVIFLITDGSPNCTGSLHEQDDPYEESAQQVKLAEREGIKVYGIGLGYCRDEDMTRIFERKWGHFEKIESIGSYLASEIMKHVVRKI